MISPRALVIVSISPIPVSSSLACSSRIFSFSSDTVGDSLEFVALSVTEAGSSTILLVPGTARWRSDHFPVGVSWQSVSWPMAVAVIKM